MLRNVWFKSCLTVLMGCCLGGAQAPCDGGCPVGAINGPNRSCLYEVVADGRWTSVNGGELKVQIPSQSQARIGRFAFWFIQDPQEQHTQPTWNQRVGRWKLLIRNYEPGDVPQQLTISWRLRARPSGLRSHETVRLALVRRKHHHESVSILPGSFEQTSQRVKATISKQTLPYDGLYLVPVRYTPMIGHKLNTSQQKQHKKI